MTTYRVFATPTNAARYALACHLRFLRRRADQGDGTLKRIDTWAKENVTDWPDDHEQLRTWLASLTAAELRAVQARVARLPLMGRRGHDGSLNETDGYTTAWAVPRQTKDGRWAVECPPFDTSGVAAPEWPDPPPTI